MGPKIIKNNFEENKGINGVIKLTDLEIRKIATIIKVFSKKQGKLNNNEYKSFSIAYLLTQRDDFGKSIFGAVVPSVRTLTDLCNALCTIEYDKFLQLTSVTVYRSEYRLNKICDLTWDNIGDDMADIPKYNDSPNQKVSCNSHCLNYALSNGGKSPYSLCNGKNI